MASLVESADDAIVAKSLDGIIRSWNPGAERLLGYSAKEIIGQPVTRLLPENRLDEEAMILGRIGRGERVEQFETVRRKKRRLPGGGFAHHLAHSRHQWSHCRRL